MPLDLRSKVILRFHKILFLAFLLNLIIPFCAMYLASNTGKYNQYGWWLAATAILIAGVEHFFGKESANPFCDQQRHKEKSIYYSFLLYMCLTAAAVLSFCGAYLFSGTNELNWLGRIGWIVSLGMAISALALPPCHELMHCESKIGRLIGGFFLAFICNAAFNIEHVRGHHVHVATPEDYGSAALNQSFFHFLPYAFINTFVKAWLIEKKRLSRKNMPALGWRNELISWHLITLMVAIIYYFVFGLPGLIFFIGQGLVAMTSNYIITYIQHYGLRRLRLDNGRYEKFCANHAWDSNFLVSNMTSFCLPRHTDHHLNPRRPYQLRRHLEESLQMPLGYFGMFFMALIPPLWFKVMNQRVMAFNREMELKKQNRDGLDIKDPTYLSTN